MTQFYIGVKQIEAWEQAHEDGSPGYAVKYPDGYLSWSPKDVFEKAYFPQGQDPTKIPQEMVDIFIMPNDASKMTPNTTVKVGRMRNQFEVVVGSSCVDQDNYDHDIGTDLCDKKIRDKAWEMLGFVLCWARNGLVR